MIHKTYTDKEIFYSIPLQPVGKDSVDVTPWLIVDMSNVTGCVGFMYGGHRAVFDHYLESYWRAVYIFFLALVL